MVDADIQTLPLVRSDIEGLLGDGAWDRLLASRDAAWDGEVVPAEGETCPPNKFLQGMPENNSK